MKDGRGARASTWSALIGLWAFATVPFVPAVREFLAGGIPDVLLTGDGAVLELGTFRAAHGLQLLGPYSRFGWSHPGPAYFYLAAPFYEALSERGTALNVFALTCDYLAALAIVFIAYRLRGVAFALVVAALVAVYVLVGAPFLLANEWNPILPILPFAGLSFAAVALSLGDGVLLPAFAFLASAIVQTHIGYGPELLSLSLGVAAMRTWGNGDGAIPPIGKGAWIVTAAVLAACWTLPLYETATRQPGNLVLIARFFVPKHWAEHTWREAARTVATQMAIMPEAIAQTLRMGATPWTARTSTGVASAEVLALVFIGARASVDRSLKTMSWVVLVQIVVALLAVRAIRGEIEVYLVAWVSVVGLVSLSVIGAWLLGEAARAIGARAESFVTVIATIVIGLAVTSPVPRSSVIRPPDATAIAITERVEAYLTSAQVIRPTVRMATPETWPIAAATVLDLTKRGVPVSVEDPWTSVVGSSFAAPPGSHPELLFGNRAFDAASRNQVGLTFVARSGDVAVYRR